MFLPRRNAARFLVLPAYVIVTTAILWSILPAFSKAIPSSQAFDPALQAFLVGWDWHALTTTPAGVFHLPIFYPEPLALTYMDSMLGETLLGSPALAMGASIATAYNLVLVLSFVLSAWATYRLVRLFGVPRWPSFLSGLLFAFSPFRFANLDLLNQLQTQLIPVALFFAVRYVRRARVRDALGALVTVVAQVYLGWYDAFYILVLLAGALLYAWIARLRTFPRDQRSVLALATVGASLAVLPVAMPYLQQHASTPGFRRSLGEAALYSADVLDYFRTNPHLPESRLMPSGAQSYWPGLVAFPLALIGVSDVVRRRDRIAYLLPILGLTGCLLSLGPVLHVGGHRFMIPLPYSALYFVPGFSSMRAPARLAVMVALSAAALAGIGGRRLYEGLGSGKRAGIVFAALTAATVGLAAYAPIPLLTLPRRETMPSIYTAVAEQPAGLPLLEIPVPPDAPSETRTDALRQFLLLYHGKPRLDGTSGYVSERYLAFRHEIQSFPGASALSAASRLGARLVLIHYGDLGTAAAAHLEKQVAAVPRLRLVARAGDDALYQLRP